MYTVKWAVMQYVVLRPIVSITGIVCQVYGVLCESVGFGINAIHFQSPAQLARDLAQLGIHTLTTQHK